MTKSKQLYIPSCMYVGMNQINNKVLVGLIATLAVSLLIAGTQSVSAKAMYEDQIQICNFDNVCQIVNIDDVMNKTQAEKVWNNFNNELDTFGNNLIEQLDEECKQNYHKFCFGEEWSNLNKELEVK